jgi:hypothetical protein
MDAITQTEINRINSPTVYSDFEIDVMTDVADWLMSQQNWLETYGSYENAVKAFWKEKLDQ